MCSREPAPQGTARDPCSLTEQAQATQTCPAHEPRIPRLRSGILNVSPTCRPSPQTPSDDMSHQAGHTHYTNKQNKDKASMLPAACTATRPPARLLARQRLPSRLRARPLPLTSPTLPSHPLRRRHAWLPLPPPRLPSDRLPPRMPYVNDGDGDGDGDGDRSVGVRKTASDWRSIGLPVIGAGGTNHVSTWEALRCEVGLVRSSPARDG